MNNSKNKLNNKISWLYNLEPKSEHLDRNYLVFGVLHFASFFLFFFSRISTFRKQILLFIYCLHTVHALFTGLTTTLFKKNIKNGTHNTIHTFKKSFITVFLIFSKIKCVQMDFRYNIFVPLNLHESIKCNSNPFLIFYLFKDCFMTHSADF